MNRTLAGAALLIVLLAGAWAWRAHDSGARSGYILAPVETGRLQRMISATGSVHTVLSVDVGSQVSGRIDSVDVDFNDPVTAGQAIARLDQHSFLANRAAAQAALAVALARVGTSEAVVDRAAGNLASAEARQGVYTARVARATADLQQQQLVFDRKLELSKKGALSQDELDEIKAGLAKSRAELEAAKSEAEVQVQETAIAGADLRQAEGGLLEARALVPQRQADLDLAEVELERTVIRSPIDGIVIDRAIEPGQTVAASLEAPKLFTIARDLAAMEVHALIDEADIGLVEAGQQAVFSVDAYPDRSFSGEVRQIRKAPQQSRGVIKYVAIIATHNPDLALLPGMTALVGIAVLETGPVTQIPKRALRFQPPAGAVPRSAGQEADPDQATVWALDGNGRPRPIAVQLGRSDDSGVELTGGELRPGDEVIIGLEPSGE